MIKQKIFQEQLAGLLNQGKTISEIAQILKVSRPTIYKYLPKETPEQTSKPAAETGLQFRPPTPEELLNSIIEAFEARKELGNIKSERDRYKKGYERAISILKRDIEDKKNQAKRDLEWYKAWQQNGLNVPDDKMSRAEESVKEIETLIHETEGTGGQTS
jgi:predicted transcriptional regulator